MAINYSNLRSMANTKITENGRSVTLRKVSREAANHNKPWRGNNPGQIEESVTTTAVFVPLGGSDIFGETRELLIGSNRQFHTNTFLLSGIQTFDPFEYNIIVDSSNVWRITRVTELKPGSLILLYYLEVER